MLRNAIRAFRALNCELKKGCGRVFKSEASGPSNSNARRRGESSSANRRSLHQLLICSILLNLQVALAQPQPQTQPQTQHQTEPQDQNQNQVQRRHQQQLKSLSDSSRNVELVGGCVSYAALPDERYSARGKVGGSIEYALPTDAERIARLQFGGEDDCDLLDYGFGLGLGFDIGLDSGDSMNKSGSSANCSNSTDQFRLLGSEFSLVFPLAWTVAIAAMSITLSLVTVVGNVIVLTSFAIDRQIRQATNYFIASLAVSDLLIGLFSMNFYTLYLLLDENWPLGDMLCDLWLALDYTVCLASQYTVFFITVDRFCSVKMPAKYRNWRTDNKVVAMVTVSWLVPALIFFTSIIGWENFTGRPRYSAPGERRCVVGFADETLFNILLTVFYYWIPLVIMCGLSAGIYHVALTLSRKSEAKARRREQNMALGANANGSQHDVVDANVTCDQLGSSKTPVTGEKQSSEGEDPHTSTAITSSDDRSPKFPHSADRKKQPVSLVENSSSTTVVQMRSSLDKNSRQQEGPNFRSSLQVPHTTASSQRVAVSSVNLTENRVCGEVALPNRASFAGSTYLQSPLSPSDSQVLSEHYSLGANFVDLGVPDEQRVAISKRLQFCGDVLVRNRDLNVQDVNPNGSPRQSDANFMLHRVNQALLTYTLCASPDTFACFKFVDQESVRSFGSESSAHTRTLGELLPQFKNFSFALSDFEDAADSVSTERRRSRISNRASLISADLNVNLRNGSGNSPLVALTNANVLHNTESANGLCGVTGNGNGNGRSKRPDSYALPQSLSAVSVLQGSGAGTGTAGVKAVLGPASSNSLTFPSNVRTEIVQLDSSESKRSMSGVDDASSAGELVTEKRKEKDDVTEKTRSSTLTSVSQRFRETWQSLRSGCARIQSSMRSFRVADRPSSQQKKSRSENRARKALRMIVFILGAFMICWTPYHILIFVSSGCGDCVNVHLYRFTYWLCYLNSPINPFCYAFMNAQFKKTFLRILRFDLRRT